MELVCMQKYCQQSLETGKLDDGLEERLRTWQYFKWQEEFWMPKRSEWLAWDRHLDLFSKVVMDALLQSGYPSWGHEPSCTSEAIQKAQIPEIRLLQHLKILCLLDKACLHCTIRPVRAILWDKILQARTICLQSLVHSWKPGQHVDLKHQLCLALWQYAQKGSDMQAQNCWQLAGQSK